MITVVVGVALFIVGCGVGGLVVKMVARHQQKKKDADADIEKTLKAEAETKKAAEEAKKAAEEQAAVLAVRILLRSNVI